METYESDKLLRLTQEHKIIYDFIARFERYTSKNSYEQLGKLLKSIYTFLEQDLERHFMLEEISIFPIATEFDNSTEKKELIDKLEEQHKSLSKELKIILHLIKTCKWVTFKGNEEFVIRMKKFIHNMKVHIKLELEELYPPLEQNDEAVTKILRS